MNYIKRFWNGDISLVISYWVIGCLLNIIVSFIIGFVLTFIFALIGISDISLNLFLNLFLFAWVIFLTVGIWRSANKYQGKKIWVYLTKIVLIIGIIYLIGETIVNPTYFID